MTANTRADGGKERETDATAVDTRSSVTAIGGEGIFGTVTDTGTGDPVGGVAVTVTDASSGATEAATVTDPGGGYSVAVTPGTFDVACDERTYDPASATVTVGTGETIEQNFALDARAYKVLGELTGDYDVGVLGRNLAESGAPVGVRGSVPNAAEGYGLETPDDAMVAGTVDSLETFQAAADGDVGLRVGAAGVDTGGRPAGGTVVGGYEGNVAEAAGAVIGGGGTPANNFEIVTIGPGINEVYGEYGVIGGGLYNTVYGGRDTIGGGINNQTATSGDTYTYATVGGGSSNSARGNSSAIGGGNNNTTYKTAGTIGGGRGNDVEQEGGTVGGGESNDAFGPYDTIAGGQNNVTQEPNSLNGWAAVGGGENNEALRSHSVVAGGSGNVARSAFDTIGGGQNNRTSPFSGSLTAYATVGGGNGNVADGQRSVVGGGINNTALGTDSTVGGGNANEALGQGDTVAGGDGNTSGVSGFGGRIHATVAGGRDNVAQEPYSTVGGGQGNLASGTYATVGGGNQNDATSFYATVPGGFRNTASAEGAFAAGERATAQNSDTFVWNDGTKYHDTTGNGVTDSLSSAQPVGTGDPTGDNTFHVGATGGVRFITGSSSVTYLDGGTAGWQTTSSRSSKTEIEPVDTEAVLAGVAEMEVATWQYRDDAAGADEGEGDGEAAVRYVGPMAEDFDAVLDGAVGTGDGTINGINADGLAFAAIQGLADRDERKEARIEALEADNEQLRADNDALVERNDRLESRLAALEAHLELDDRQATAGD